MLAHLKLLKLVDAMIHTLVPHSVFCVVAWKKKMK